MAISATTMIGGHPLINGYLLINQIMPSINKIPTISPSKTSKEISINLF